jgi:hypothetical protein
VEIYRNSLHTIYNSAFPSDTLFLVGICDISYYATGGLYYCVNGMINPLVTCKSVCSWGLTCPALEIMLSWDRCASDEQPRNIHINATDGQT